MNERTLKGILAVTFIFSQFMILGLAFYYWQAWGGFSLDEATDNALTVAPITTAYAAAMMRHVFAGGGVVPHSAASRRPQTENKKSIPYTLLSLGLFAAFVVSLGLLCRAKAHSSVSFDQYKKAVSVVDTVFAGYLALVVASLFESPPIGRR